jgi:hypothetical protein
MADEVFLVSEAVGDLLRALEREDIVLYEKVDLNACIPALDAPMPTLRSRQGKKALIDPESLTKVSIAAASKERGPDDSGRREKDELIRRRAQLEETVQEKNRLLQTLQGEKQRLEEQLSDRKTRSRFGSRASVIHVEPQQLTAAPVAENVRYWKRMYEEMNRKFELLLQGLNHNGSMKRVSMNRSRQIDPPDGALRFDTGGD